MKATAIVVTMALAMDSVGGAADAKGAVAGVADHMRKFWDPRMKAMITAHAAAGGAGRGWRR